MTDELEKLQRKGTKPTCPHCHATVLSSSAIALGRERSDDLLRECGYEPKAATPADDSVSFIRILGEELCNAGMPAGDRSVILANIRSLIADQATPAVGGDETENFQRWLVDHLMPSEFSHSYLFKVDENGDYCHSFVLDAWDGWKARAAQPASPSTETAFLNLCEVLGLQATPLAYLDAVAARAAILAASPLREFTEQELVVIQELSEHHQVSQMQTLRQALRFYQLHENRIRNGETFAWSGDKARAEEFAGLAVPASPLRGREDIETLLALLNPLHGDLDKQTYDEKVSLCFDAPRDHEYAVTVTAQQERDLNQAILILESRLRND